MSFLTNIKSLIGFGNTTNASKINGSQTNGSGSSNGRSIKTNGKATNQVKPPVNGSTNQEVFDTFIRNVEYRCKKLSEALRNSDTKSFADTRVKEAALDFFALASSNKNSRLTQQLGELFQREERFLDACLRDEVCDKPYLKSLVCALENLLSEKDRLSRFARLWSPYLLSPTKTAGFQPNIMALRFDSLNSSREPLNQVEMLREMFLAPITYIALTSTMAALLHSLTSEFFPASTRLSQVLRHLFLAHCVQHFDFGCALLIAAYCAAFQAVDESCIYPKEAQNYQKLEKQIKRLREANSNLKSIKVLYSGASIEDEQISATSTSSEDSLSPEAKVKLRKLKSDATKMKIKFQALLLEISERRSDFSELPAVLFSEDLSLEKKAERLSQACIKSIYSDYKKVMEDYHNLFKRSVEANGYRNSKGDREGLQIYELLETSHRILMERGSQISHV